MLRSGVIAKKVGMTRLFMDALMKLDLAAGVDVQISV